MKLGDVHVGLRVRVKSPAAYRGTVVELPEEYMSINDDARWYVLVEWDEGRLAFCLRTRPRVDQLVPEDAVTRLARLVDK